MYILKKIKEALQILKNISDSSLYYLLSYHTTFSQTQKWCDSPLKGPPKAAGVDNFCRFFINVPAIFGNPLTWALMAFGNPFVIALAAFSKNSRNYSSSLKKYLKYLRTTQ
jgi:hypothetical protein